MNKNEIREKIEKYDALIRYTENYDYKNLPTLMFPKEDKSYLLMALNNFKMTLEHMKPDEERYPNTEITYIYRDISNNKKWFTCVLKGHISKEQMEIIHNCLYDKRYLRFNPKMVGLPDGNINDGILDMSELSWFQWMENSVLWVDTPATISITVEELVQNFQKAKENNWEINREIERE